MEKTKVLFVCLGNICRSPTAEGALRQLVDEAGLAGRFEIDSAGTGSWHVGQAPDRHAQAACRRAGFDISGHRARQVRKDDFERFDLILACDAQNQRDLEHLAPASARGRIRLLRSFDPLAAGPRPEVPDPWGMGQDAFEETVAICKRACQGLLEALRAGQAV